MTFTVQHKRSSTANRRPDPTALEDGQVAINTNNTQPGLFFKTSTGALSKVGPPILSAAAPTTPTNYTSFSRGELWVNTTSNSVSYYTGSAWQAITVGQTLQSVTDSGATTTNTLTVAGLVAGGLTYPTADGTNGQVLSTDGSGTLSWIDNETITLATLQTETAAATSFADFQTRIAAL